MGGLFCLLNVELVLGWSPVVCLLRGTKMSNWQEGVKNSQKDERESTIWGVVGEEEEEETSCHAHHVYKMLRFGVGGFQPFLALRYCRDTTDPVYLSGRQGSTLFVLFEEEKRRRWNV